VIIGDDEALAGLVSVKPLRGGMVQGETQSKLSLQAASEFIKSR